ncbi:MAG TPA: hypothetical protein EYP52_09865 [Anaerolineae bacterium]|nr:hypothetical protein [Anaerolineae bacterium]
MVEVVVGLEAVGTGDRGGARWGRGGGGARGRGRRGRGWIGGGRQVIGAPATVVADLVYLEKIGARRGGDQGNAGLNAVAQRVGVGEDRLVTGVVDHDTQVVVPQSVRHGFHAVGPVRHRVVQPKVILLRITLVPFVPRDERQAIVIRQNRCVVEGVDIGQGIGGGRRQSAGYQVRLRGERIESVGTGERSSQRGSRLVGEEDGEKSQ